MLLACMPPPVRHGKLLGTAAVFRANKFFGDAAKAKIVVACRDKVTTFEADERGDYAIELATGKYRLVKAVARDGREFRISGKQARTFIITDGKTTRFDIMIDH